MPAPVLRALPEVSHRRVGQGLKVFLDVAYERAGDDFLTRKALPALDASRRLAVISTPAAFASVPDASGLPQPNWLCREIDHFFDQRGAQAQSATIVALKEAARRTTVSQGA